MFSYSYTGGLLGIVSMPILLITPGINTPKFVSVLVLLSCILNWKDELGRKHSAVARKVHMKRCIQNASPPSFLWYAAI